MLFLVDTISFRVRSMDVKKILDFLYLPGMENESFWVKKGKYNNNYSQSLYSDGIIIGYNGQQGYNSYVYMSGRGCRHYEDLRGSDFDWLSFLTVIFENSDEFSFTRLDLACDDRTKALNLNRLEAYYIQGKYSSRVKYFERVKFGREIFYIGSPRSDCFLRIYDKKKERGYLPDELDGLPWYRAEFQMRDDHATQFVGAWISSGNVGKTFLGFLAGHIRFLKEPNPGHHSDRIQTAGFWSAFIGNAGKLKFVSSVGSDYNLSKLENYIIHQCGSSLLTFIRCKNFTAEEFKEFIEIHAHELRPDQRQLIEKYQDIYARSEEFKTRFNKVYAGSPYLDDEHADPYQMKLDMLEHILRH